MPFEGLRTPIAHHCTRHCVMSKHAGPLALAVVGGLTSSTALSLFLVPSMFTLLAKRAAPSEDDREAKVATPKAAEA